MQALIGQPWQGYAFYCVRNFLRVKSAISSIHSHLKLNTFMTSPHNWLTKFSIPDWHQTIIKSHSYVTCAATDGGAHDFLLMWPQNIWHGFCICPKKQSKTKNACLLLFLQDRILWWQVLKMRIHFWANKMSLPGLFFDAFCSKYWERLRLPLHHTHTATGSPAGIKDSFTRDWMNMRKEIHRD